MATTEGTKIIIPPSRIVWGHPGKQRQRTDNNQKPIIKADGTPAMQYIYGLAIPKHEFGPVWAAMQAEAAKGYSQGVPQNFAWKYDDGDDTRPVNGGGVPYAQREGYPGHYVITIASALDSPPPLFRFNPQTGGYDQMPHDQLKCGDFVVSEINIVCNVPENRSHTPSLYLNPTGLEFIGHGKEIVSAAAINPMQAFGGRQYQLPPGASATPVSSAPAGVGMPQQPPMPGPGGAPQYAPPVQQHQPPAYQPPAYQPPAYQPPAYQPPAYQPPAYQPQPAPQYAPPVQQQPMAPQYAPQPVPGGYPPPATGFVDNAGGAPQYAPPQAAPQYAPPPGAPQYASAPQVPQYAPQPVPGQMPPR